MAHCWYWYTFEDGYQACVRGMDIVELAWEEKRHGKLVSRPEEQEHTEEEIARAQQKIIDQLNAWKKKWNDKLP